MPSDPWGSRLVGHREVHSLETKGTRPVGGPHPPMQAEQAQLEGQGNSKQIERMKKIRENALWCEPVKYRLAMCRESLRDGLTPTRKVSGSLASRQNPDSHQTWMRVGLTPTRKLSAHLARRDYTGSHNIPIFPVLNPVAISVELYPHPMGPST